MAVMRRGAPPVSDRWRRTTVLCLAAALGLGTVFGVWHSASVASPAREAVRASSVPVDAAAVPEARPVPGMVVLDDHHTGAQPDVVNEPPPIPATDPHGHWLRPADGPYTSGFGMRFHPVLQVTKLHTGLDVGADCGQPVRAVRDGVVQVVAENDGYGLRVMLDHGVIDVGPAESGRQAQVTTLYAHLSSAGVRVGETVQQGRVIGMVGTSGLSTGCHLHLETIVDGAQVDPLTVVVFGDHPLPSQGYTVAVRAQPKPTPTPTPTPNPSSTAPIASSAAPSPGPPAPSPRTTAPPPPTTGTTSPAPAPTTPEPAATSATPTPSSAPTTPTPTTATPQPSESEPESESE